MTKTMLAILALLLGAGCASTSNVMPQDGSASQSFNYWLHPKLGMVKVDRATNAMVTARTLRATHPQAESRGTLR